MSVVPALLGIALVLSILRDLFHEFFHPAGAGSVSGKVQRGVWRTFRRVSRRCSALLEFAGPAALVAVLLTPTRCRFWGGHATMLWEGCGDLASIVGVRFLGRPQAPADEVLEAFAADHRWEPVTRGAGG